MKKKIISALLCASMVASMAAGCGSSDTADTTTTDNTCLLYTSPVLIGAKNALEVLKSSAYVELDSENGVVTAI